MLYILTLTEGRRLIVKAVICVCLAIVMLGCSTKPPKCDGDNRRAVNAGLQVGAVNPASYHCS